jgi:hypothetical protein
VAVSALLLTAIAVGCVAAEMRAGSRVEVKSNAIWFEDRAKLSEWQRLKKAGDAAALQAYETQVLGTREAWQFTKPLAVTILGIETSTDQVNVEMTTPGRLEGSVWLLDAAAIAE